MKLFKNSEADHGHLLSERWEGSPGAGRLGVASGQRWDMESGLSAWA